MRSDIIIIGAGPGGYETAIYAASKGKTVTLFEADKVGGTCLNRGCIPTKTLCQNADIASCVKNASLFGVECQLNNIDYAKVVARKNDVVSQLRDGVALALKSPQITLVNGEAEIDENGNVICNGEKYECDNLIIATGSSPKFLPIEGAHHNNVLTSDEILDIDSLPESLCIIGGGVIGMEFASIFSRFGVVVSVVEFCKEIIPNLDADVAKRLRQTLSKSGININVNAGVTSVNEDNGAMVVCYEQKGKQLEVRCDKVLMAVGRAPRFPKGLEKVGINFTPKGIVVDDNMQTNLPNIYAIGDVNGLCMLAHVATFQGKRAVNAICGISDTIRFDIVPSAVFTSPEASSVGLTEAQCKDLGFDYESKKALFRANGKAVSMNEVDGIVKLLIDKNKRTILGAHIMGPHAADLIQEVVVLMNKNVVVDDCKDIIHSHPTLSEVVQSALHQF